MIFAPVIPAAFSLLNRARGSQLWGLTDSTTIGRLVATCGMALVTALLQLTHGKYNAEVTDLSSWALLMFWCVWEWDAYWSAAIGNDPLHSRLWGTVMMTLRMGLILPFYAFLMWWEHAPAGHALYALSTLLLGLPYYISGHLTPGSRVIENAELAVGAIIGFTV